MERNHPYSLVFDEQRYREISNERHEFCTKGSLYAIDSEVGVLEELIATGASDRHIATSLDKSYTTIRMTMSQLYAKFCEGKTGFKRIQLIHVLAQEGIVTRVENKEEVKNY